jgi:Type II secretion system (T2SS), protein M subtype b
MNAVLMAQLRRNWPVAGAVVVFLLFLVIHLTSFRPAVARYQKAIKEAGDLGMPLDPNYSPRLIPPRVFALLAENSLPAGIAEQRGASGELTSQLLDDISHIASKHGVEVTATEPGATVHQPKAVQVRAHLRANCSFAQFVGFVDDLSQGNSLVAIDRFSLANGPGSRRMLDLWVTRYILKQTGTRK